MKINDSVDPKEDLDTQRVLPHRNFGLLTINTIVVIVVLLTIYSVADNKNYGWPIVGENLFDGLVLKGLMLTFELTVIALILGLIFGVCLALMRLHQSSVLRWLAALYIWLFRGTPLLVQILFWYNISALYPSIRIGIPWGPTFWSGNVNSIITAFVAAVLALGLHEAAFMSEVVRAGIQGVDGGQIEAGKAVGLRSRQVFFMVTLPQAIRLIIPAIGNRAIAVLKDSSLVSVIGAAELLFSAEVIYGRTYQTIPLLVVATIWYLVSVTLLTLIQRYIERMLANKARNADE